MSNPSPVMGREFLEQQFKRQFDEPLAKAGVCIRFKESVDKKLRAIAGYSDIVRIAVDRYFESDPKPQALLEDDGRPMLTIGARIPAAAHDLIKLQPNSSAWLRRVITEAAQRELMKDSEI
jgi:hypothetical protein